MGVAYFLLLSSLGLAITVQAQDCPKPVPGPNMNLKDTDILLTTFPDGTKVSFTCEVGYTPAGGSAVITCSAGSWSSVRLRCEKKNCGSAGEVTNGFIDYPEGTEFGNKAVIKCDDGYELVGKAELICGDQGWMGRLPECEVVICDPPPPVVNGDYSPKKEDYSYRDVVLYSCVRDYTLVGSKSRTCSENGTFHPESPTCSNVQCMEPNIANAEWDGGSRPPYKPSSTVTYRCKTGYNIKGQQTLTCGINGEWSPGLPTCQLVKCPKPPMIVNGAFSPNKEEYSYKDVVQFSCNKGYRLSGSISTECSEDGTFSSRPPTCIIVKCPKPPMIVNGAFSPNKEEYSYKDVVQFSCNKGYRLSGSISTECSEDGTFSSRPPTCIRSTTSTTPATITPTEEPKDNGGDIPKIVGGIFGIVIFLAIVCFGCRYCGCLSFLKKQTQRSLRDSPDKEPAKDEAERMPLS